MWKKDKKNVYVSSNVGIFVLLICLTLVNAFSVCERKGEIFVRGPLIPRPRPELSLRRKHSFRYASFMASMVLKGKSDETNDEKDKVQVGSGEYYEGFFQRSLEEEPLERVSGDAILGPTFKFVGGASAILIVLFFAFLLSNGLLSL